MRIYVAGSSRELERAKSAMACVRYYGNEITHDWTADIEAARAAGFASDADLSVDARLEHAASDLQAVLSAEIVWLLTPQTQTAGAWAEFGIALGVRGFFEAPRVICSGRGHERYLFCALANRIFETDIEAANWIAGGAR